MFTYSQIFFQYLCLPVNMVKPVLYIYLHCCRPLCWVPRAVVEEEVKLADALALIVLIQFFSRFMRSWRCKSIYTQKKKNKQLAHVLIYYYLLLDIVGDIKDEAIVRIVWPSQFQLVELDRDQVCFHLMITKVIPMMVIFLMLLMIMMVMFMIAMSHMMARLMMVLVIMVVWSYWLRWE